MGDELVSFWSGKRVLITGHTGFKGSWLSAWLNELDAKVFGYALEPPTEPNMFESCGLEDRMTSHIGDIADLEELTAFVTKCLPEIVFHLAAEPIVRASYTDPVTTFSTNVLGTVHVLEAARQAPGVRAVVNVTSDKCYENSRNTGAHSEDDPMGGADPYSASKGCAELAAASYIDAFSLPVASVRAGNVLGGGDWAPDRILPDCIRSLIDGVPIKIRNPRSVRPWQHVLDPLKGYLMVGENLLRDGVKWSGGWNFGPLTDKVVPVSDLVQEVIALWGSGAWQTIDDNTAVAEAPFLALDASKARDRLGWSSGLEWVQAIDWAVSWYRRAMDEVESTALYEYTTKQIRDYQELVNRESVSSKVR